MDLKAIKKESKELSEQLFIEHNISDVRSKRLVNEYFYNKIYERELAKEIQVEMEIEDNNESR